MTVRRMQIEDYTDVYNLWLATPRMGLNDVDDSEQGINRMLQRNPTLSFIAEKDNQLVAVIIAGQDGRRGYIYHTAVHLDYRRQGIAQELIKNVLDEMKALNISKVGLFIFQDNYSGNSFWNKMGFNIRDDLYYRNHALTELERIDT
ncbi:GNAT family N-acetyltransferase [uncultured Psychrobacter sp.]|uniref:GNAT family N-acetyltransferase n=1 Tax=uncultured Psychrobacter sp. TaxID=259303 RepID=UPI00345955C7